MFSVSLLVCTSLRHTGNSGHFWRIGGVVSDWKFMNFMFPSLCIGAVRQHLTVYDVLNHTNLKPHY